jgi:hypothetical protein
LLISSVILEKILIVNEILKMNKLYFALLIGCFVFISCYLSFSISFEAGIVVSALLLEFFSRTLLKNHRGVW